MKKAEVIFVVGSFSTIKSTVRVFSCHFLMHYNGFFSEWTFNNLSRILQPIFLLGFSVPVLISTC